MIAGQGLFQLTTRSETFRYQANLQAANEARTGKSAAKLPANAQSGPMKEFWTNAAKAASERLPSADTLQHLEQAARSDNKEVSAQKIQQAKAKLQSLRLQAQMAAASGDKQTLKRIAQEVAAAARDVAGAARDLAGGIAGSVSESTSSAAAGSGAPAEATASAEAPGAAVPSDTSKPNEAGPAVAEGAGTAPQPKEGRDPSEIDHRGTEHQGAVAEPGESANKAATKPGSDQPIYAQEPAVDADKDALGQKALQSLNDDASMALAQARGLLAFLATAARAKRNAREDADDGRFFDELNRVVDTAEQEMRMAFSRAGHDILASSPGNGTAATASGTSDVTVTQVTVTQVTVTAALLNITA